MKTMKAPPSLPISLLISATSFLGVLIFYFNLQPQVPLFYSLARKSQYLAAKGWLFLFPALSLLITLVHFSILKMIHTADPLLIKLFTWITVGMQVLLGIALLRIILIIS